MEKEKSDSLAVELSKVIPRNLDDIIRANRHFAELRLATAEDMSTLQADIAPGIPKDGIENWHFINLHIKPDNFSQVLLLGYIQGEGNPWITSPVTGIDLQRGLVMTRSGSLYAIGQPAGMQPGPELLATVCAALHKWGMGEFLGVPAWFF